MVFDLSPRSPVKRPLFWPDWILDLQEILLGQPNLPDIFVVGGAVRDALLHRPVKDIDLATPEHAIRLARRITDILDGDIFVMDEERGVARVFFRTQEGEQLTIDVADFRAGSLLDDLLARDFTLNAIAVDFLADLGQIIDPLNGESDANDHILRRCSPHSLVDDPIRCLRGVRQSVQLGTRIEPQTLADIRRLAPEIARTSPERIRDEFVNLLSVEKPSSALRIAKAVGVLDVALPQVAAMTTDDWLFTLNAVERLNDILLAISFRRTDNTAAAFDLGMMVMQFDRYRKQLNEQINAVWANNRPNRSLLFLAALIYVLGQEKQAIGRIADTLRLSVPEKRQLVAYIQAAAEIISMETDDNLMLHRYWYRWQESGIGAVLVALAVARASYNVELEQNAWLALIERARSLLAAYFDLYEEIVQPPALVDGHLLKQTLNIGDGPIIGDLLSLIREAQVTGEVSTQDEALQLAENYLRSQS